MVFSPGCMLESRGAFKNTLEIKELCPDSITEADKIGRYNVRPPQPPISLYMFQAPQTSLMYSQG